MQYIEIYQYIYSCLFLSMNKFLQHSRTRCFPRLLMVSGSGPSSTFNLLFTLTDFDNAPANLWACAWQVSHSTASLFWALRDQLDDGVHVGVWSTWVPQCTVLQWWLGTDFQIFQEEVRFTWSNYINQITPISWIEVGQLGQLKHPGSSRWQATGTTHT